VYLKFSLEEFPEMLENIKLHEKELSLTSTEKCSENLNQRR